LEPDKQVEVQLGHMCNNRCVFCVSGQMTERRAAGPLDLAPQLEAIERAHAQGYRKLTLLGGEPTLQPGFMDLVRRSVALGFDEIVIFTNGVRTARAEFLDEILATGGPFTFRISIQGATEEAHERTTRKPGSFGRILRTLELLRERGQRRTVNMCVVTSNYASVAAFPELVERYGVSQIHLDMIRPLDAGDRTEAELRAMIPRYCDMVPALVAMAKGFADQKSEVDVNIGNLPYCIAPSDKYEVKRRDKLKPESCRSCAYEPSCSGVFETYARFYGTSELIPLGKRTDTARRDPPLARTVDARIARLRRAAPFGALAWRGVVVREEGQLAEVLFEGPDGERVAFWLAERDGKPSGGYRLDHGVASPPIVASLRAMIDALRVRLA
jgi:MoaA/NifB/PqqE/SkfB family radical SAM enzyme